MLLAWPGLSLPTLSFLSGFWLIALGCMQLRPACQIGGAGRLG
jgi:hypothetical protein